MIDLPGSAGIIEGDGFDRANFRTCTAGETDFVVYLRLGRGSGFFRWSWFGFRRELFLNGDRSHGNSLMRTLGGALAATGTAGGIGRSFL